MRLLGSKPTTTGESPSKRSRVGYKCASEGELKPPRPKGH